MALDLQENLTRINEKARFLVARYRALLEANKKLQQRVEELEKEVTERNRRLERLETRSEYLEISSSLAPDSADLESTRDMIADLVREVDRCIADLNS